MYVYMIYIYIYIYIYNSSPSAQLSGLRAGKPALWSRIQCITNTWHSPKTNLTSVLPEAMLVIMPEAMLVIID